MKRMLVISHVLPFPGHSGQEQRVRQSLISLRKHFHVTFLTAVAASCVDDVSERLSEYCDQVVCIESRLYKSRTTKLLHQGIGYLFSLFSSLKSSNYVVGHLDLTPKRVKDALGPTDFDVVLFEYWHAFRSVNIFRNRNTPCILDMHNILWAAFEQQQMRRKLVPSWLKRRRIQKYRMAEERAWKEFDGIVAINTEERSHVENLLADKAKIFLAPMGIDLENWPYVWQPDGSAPRVAYYGGLASVHNQQSALTGYNEIMPEVWRQFPDAEFWVIGSNPPPTILELSKKDPRVKVTGFVENIQQVLAGMSAVVCPWTGRYGFRSRLIEVIASGIPLVTTHDAIHGMELTHNKDVLLGATNDELAAHVLDLLNDPVRSQQQSITGRKTVERLYSTQSTYDKLSQDLGTWLDTRSNAQ